MIGDRLITYRPEPNVLVITKSKLAHILELLVYLLFFVFWYGMMLGTPTDLGSLIKKIQMLVSQDVNQIFFLLIPLASVPKVIRVVQIIMAGERFVFDKTQNAFFRNQEELSELRDIGYVQIRTISPLKGGNSYRLTVVLKGGAKIEIDHSGNSAEIIAVADDIADMARVKIVRK